MLGISSRKMGIDVTVYLLNEIMYFFMHVLCCFKVVVVTMFVFVFPGMFKIFSEISSIRLYII